MAWLNSSLFQVFRPLVWASTIGVLDLSSFAACFAAYVKKEIIFAKFLHNISQRTTKGVYLLTNAWALGPAAFHLRARVVIMMQVVGNATRISSLRMVVYLRVSGWCCIALQISLYGLVCRASSAVRGVASPHTMIITVYLRDACDAGPGRVYF